MFRSLVCAAWCGLTAVSLSGCCLFHHCCGWGGCGAGYGVGACGGYAGWDSGYGACVTPPGCPECATGIYGAHLDPVHRARAIRLERLRRQRGHVHGRMPRPPHGRNCGPGLGYGDAGFNDLYFDDGAGCCGDSMGCDCCSSCCDGMSFDGGLGAGWTPCESCGDGSMISGGVLEGQWIEGEPSPTPQPMQSPLPGAAPAEAEPGGSPTSLSVPQIIPGPMPVSHDQYYAPRELPAPASSTEATEVQSSAGGSPIQPVLWAPAGL